MIPRPASIAGAATLLVLVVAVAGALFLGRPDTTPPEAGPTSLQLVLREIRDDGTWSEETALRAFAAAFGELPDVEIPDGGTSEGDVAGLPLRMLAAHFDEITEEQQAAAIERAGPLAYVLTGTGGAVAARSSWFIAQTPGEYANRVNDLVSTVEGLVGRPLGLEVEVVVEDDQVGHFHAQAAPIHREGPSGPEPFHLCRIHVFPRTHDETETNLTAILGHEVWHCFQYSRLGSVDRHQGAPPWVMEGQAMWAGEALAGGADVPGKTVPYWTEYLVDEGPGRNLFARSYDAIGFYSHLHDAGTNPWSVFDAMLDALPSNLAALEAALGSQQHGIEVITTWGPGWFRDGAPTSTFALINAPGIPAIEVRPPSPAFTVANGESRSVDAGSLSAALAEVDVQAEILAVDVVGTALIGDMVFPRDIPLHDVFEPATQVWAPSPTRFFCVLDECVCPDGRPGPSERIGHELRLAVTGDWTGGSTADLRGWSLDDWCDEEEPPEGAPEGSPCGVGCASSVGDPHLRTVDLHPFSFQAAGEFTLLRSADGSFEVQARQEPYAGSTSVSINTAVAVGAGPDRVAVYATTEGLALRINGEVRSLDDTVAAGALQVRGTLDELEVEAPDGTLVWVLGHGEWGLYVVIAPSADLRATGQGLLGPVGDDRLPRLPDGSDPRIEGDGPEGRYAALYGEVADAWEVTDATTLFDYEEGAGPATYRDRAFPEPGTPLSFEELSALLQEAGLEACAAIAGSVLREQCAFDFAVTRNAGFVDMYSATDVLLAPATTPAPDPASETPGAVLTEVARISGAAVGDDGTLYLAATFDDRRNEVVAIDPRASSVVHRTEVAVRGLVAFAAGSVWVGGFENGACSIRRLSPDTLAEEARVPVDCDLGFIAPQFVAAGDAIWFQDTSGAGDDEARLRRIDPASNEPADTVRLPFRNGFLQSSGTTILFSEFESGVYRLLPGAEEFERLSDTHTTIYPGGEGFWEQVSRQLRFHDRAGADPFRLTVDGALVGAVGEVALVERNQGAGAELWAYPDQEGTPELLATAPVVGDGGQQHSLEYFGELLVGGGGGVVVVWHVQSSRLPDDGAVYVQWAQAPSP